jgi:hypothetical protein
MFEVLNSYLFQHQSISIPGLGTIFLERQPAGADIGSKNLLPPAYRFRFDKYFDAPDKDFFSFLAAERNIPDYEAIKWYSEFSFDLRNKIRQEERVPWDDVGVLAKDADGNIIFESTSTTPLFLRPVPARMVVRKDIQHNLLVGDRETTNYRMNELLHAEREAPRKETWWIYALVFSLLALGILLYHFYANQWQAASLGNQQKLELLK